MTQFNLHRLDFSRCISSCRDDTRDRWRKRSVLHKHKWISAFLTHRDSSDPWLSDDALSWSVWWRPSCIRECRRRDGFLHQAFPRASAAFWLQTWERPWQLSVLLLVQTHFWYFSYGTSACVGSAGKVWNTAFRSWYIWTSSVDVLLNGPSNQPASKSCSRSARIEKSWTWLFRLLWMVRR